MQGSRYSEGLQDTFLDLALVWSLKEMEVAHGT